MARPKKRPHYDPDKIMKNLLDAVSESYEETGELTYWYRVVRPAKGASHSGQETPT